MDTRTAWGNMDDNTRRIVVELYSQYERSGNQSTLEELRRIFKNYGDDDPDERDLVRLLR